MKHDKVRLKRKVIEQLQKMPIIETAVKKAGVPRSTYYRWRNEDSVFAKACDKAIVQGTATINDFAESVLIALIKDKDFRAIRYWLRHRHPQYQPKITFDASDGLADLLAKVRKRKEEEKDR